MEEAFANETGVLETTVGNGITQSNILLTADLVVAVSWAKALCDWAYMVQVT